MSLTGNFFSRDGIVPIKKLLQNPYLLLGCMVIWTTLILLKGITPSFSSDDYVHLEHNIHYQSLTEALEVFSKPYGREYRPLVRLSLWWNHQMTESAIAYKITNITLHILCTLLIYGLMRKLGVRLYAAILGTLVFALHPIHTTSIHFILGRTDLVAAIPYLACLLSVAHWQVTPRWWQIALSLSLFVFALLAKELSITLPAMILLVRWYKHPTTVGRWLGREQSWLWVFGIVSCGYLVVRWWMWQGMEEAISVYTNFSLSNLLINYLKWAFGLIYPFDFYQALEWYELNPFAFLFSAAFGCLCVMLLCIWIWWGSWRALLTSPLLWLGFAWILITLAPMAGGNPHRWYLYLPSAGLSLIFAGAWQHLPQRHFFHARLGLFLVLALLSHETYRQSNIWHTQSEITRGLLSDLKAQQIHELDEIYLANQPFGYQSAFLFTFSSLEEAMRVELGKSPKIHTLTYMNLDKIGAIDVFIEDFQLHFRMHPNAYKYFMLSSAERYLSQQETRYVGAVQLSINQLDETGRISHYHVDINKIPPEKLYFFDGVGFKSLKTMLPQP